MSHGDCNPDRLVEILDAQTIDACDRKVIAHLEQCEACQQQLSRFAADDWWWSGDSKSMLLETAAEPIDAGASEVFAVCDSNDTSAVVKQCDTKTNNWSVDFLEPPSHPELLGQLGKYQIEHVIGRGGMGIVLKGFDTELNRGVAIKVLSPHLASSGAARQRFSREARAAAAVVHDHVVAIYGIETDDKLPYIVMPYVGGESLQTYVAHHGPLGVKDIVRIAMQITAGLAAAHEQGLVHRDIKPANILLENGFGRVLITDFGLARAADDASITRSGLVAGTPHYMSPEQANGEAVDGRSDLFSLGSVIFFMATGRAPFRGDGAMAVLHSICHKAPQRVNEMNAAIPAPLEFVVRRLLQKSVADRFSSASELRTLLADYLAHLQNPSQCALPRELSARHPSTAIGGAVAACLAILVVVAAMWPGRWKAPSEAIKAEVIIPAPAAVHHLDFDEEVGKLQHTITEIHNQWRHEARRADIADSWDQEVRQLDELIRGLEGHP